MTIDLSNIYRFVYTKKIRKILFINNNGNMMNVFVLYLLTKALAIAIRTIAIAIAILAKKAIEYCNMQ